MEADDAIATACADADAVSNDAASNDASSHDAASHDASKSTIYVNAYDAASASNGASNVSDADDVNAYDGWTI